MASNPKVQVEITAETRALMDGLNQATGAIKNATSQIEGQFGGLSKVVGNLTAPIAAVAAALGGGAIFKGAVDGTVALAKENGALSRALGTTARESAILGTAIGDIYGNVDEFLGGAQKLVRTLGSNEAAIRGMGVATRDVNGNFRALPELLADVNAKLLEFKAGTDRDAAAAQVFGRGWRDMLRYVQLTPEVMEEARRKVDTLGLALGPDASMKVKQYRAAMNDVDDALKALKVRAGLEALPALTSLGQWFSDVAPGGIRVVVGLLQTLGSILSSQVVQVALVVGALYMLRGTLASLVGPLGAVIDKIRVQMALGAMQGVTGVRAFGGALASLVNPLTATIAVVGGAAWAIERWATAADRARKAFLDSLPAQTAQVQNAERLAERTKALGEAMEKGNQTEAQKRSNQRQLQDIQNELIAMAPEYAEALKGEAKNYQDILKAIEQVNAKKREELQLKRDAIAAEVLAAEETEARLKIEERSAGARIGGREGAAMAAGNLMMGNTAEAAHRKVIALRQALAQADQALSRLLQGTEAASGGKTFGGGGDSDAALSRLKSDLEQARYEFEATSAKAGQLMEWTKAQEVRWLTENVGLYNLNAKEKAQADRMLLDAKRAVLKEGHDAEIESLKTDLEAYKHDGEKRLEIARQIAAKEAAVHGKESKEAAAARREVLKVEQDIADQKARLTDVIFDRQRTHEEALYELERSAIEQRRNLGEISATQEIQDLAALEQRRYETERAALERRITELPAQEILARQRLYSQLQALDDRHAQAKQQSAFGLQGANQQTNWDGGLTAYINGAQQALQQWGTFAQNLMQGVENSFAQGVQGILTGQMKLAQGLKTVWKGIVSTVAGLVAQLVAKWMVAAVANKLLGKTAAESGAQQAVGAQIAAAAEIFRAHAGIPYVGPVIAAALVAMMTATLAANAGAATGMGAAAKAYAQGGPITGPTWALMGEVPGQTEIVAPDVSFKEWARNLTANVIADERAAASYRYQAAGYASSASGGGAYVDLRGATILGESTETDRLIGDRIRRMLNDRDRRNV
jgi:lambda family phage tail tape measure protein